MVHYPVVLEPDDNDTVLVSFPDFPEAHTFGETREEALMRANDALATIVDGYMRSRRPIPAPSIVKGPSATLSALMSVKVELYQAMLGSGVTKTELGKRLKWHAPQVDRLLDLNHGSKVDQIESAAAALGGQLKISVVLAGGRLTTAGGLTKTMKKKQARAVPTRNIAGSRTSDAKLKQVRKRA